MWTILVNYDEYAQGIFKSEQYAKEKLVDLVMEDIESEYVIGYEEAYDYTDGYYRVLEIKGVRRNDNKSSTRTPEQYIH